MENTKEITLKKLEKDSIPLLLEIQEEAFRVLDDPDLLRRNTYETFEVCFKEKSLVLAVYVGGEIAGFGILYAAGKDKENLAYSLDGCDDVENYANVKLTIVRPAFRGLGLQRLLIDKLCEHAAAEGFLGALSTVSPKNNFSSNNLSKCGFEAVKTLVKYGGMSRILFYKKLN